MQQGVGMADDKKANEAGGYGRYWDFYVEKWEDLHKTPDLHWAGDEWGTPEGWENLYARLLVPAGANHWRQAVEIGPGSGKYTLKVLRNTACHVRGYDVSPKFLGVCRERCPEVINDRRLTL